MSSREGVCAPEPVRHEAGRGAWYGNYKNAVSAHLTFQFTSTATPPFPNPIIPRTSKQTCHGVSLQLGCLTGSFFFFTSSCDTRSTFVRSAPASTLRSWVGSMPIISSFLFVPCAGNTPGCVGMDLTLPLGHSIPLHNRNVSAGNCRLSYSVHFVCYSLHQWMVL